MIRVLVVDDQELVRSGLRMLCESAPDLEIVAEARNGAEAVRLVDDTVPDVVLMDLRMPVIDGIAATSAIRGSRPATRVVALTTFDDDDHLYPALSAGACGLLTKDSSPAELLSAIRRAAAGENPFTPSVLQRLMARAVEAGGSPAPQAATELPTLTERELEVLTRLGAGMSNAEIAAVMNISVTTVKTHVTGIMDKTGSRSRVHLAVLAVRAGLVV
ncbi:response regulator [Nakamurella sp. YIM 132087]|uniref:Response regulator n=1 Tax=Nakamurella alba TaxID=2665158 RepID=A0A7K1FVQ0_9ACTN|nr:response regulator transcription factor [Nakamurella alba]MTD17439.1 response regulator [Nakamurella alba]